MAKPALKERIRERAEELSHVPDQLRGAWDKVVGQIRTALTFATREDVDKIHARLDAMEARLDKLAKPKKK
jgi:transcriptional regulator of NAD metabolism